jgi:hypothetical protein
VPNVNAVALDSWEAKGAGVSHMRYVMADGVYGCHIHQLSPVTYVQAHRHAAGAMILVLSGCGYEVMWRVGEAFRGGGHSKYGAGAGGQGPG